MNLNFDNRFSQSLPADPSTVNRSRQVHESAFSFVTPRIPSAPTLVHASQEVAEMIGVTADDIRSKEFIEVFSGAKVPEATQPFAMCYGGHQFGHWAGQLGDGRAINLGEVIHDKRRWMLQLKGAGATPYSRTADGLAVLRSSLREHLCSEAMYHLGVPTTRSLSLMLTGDEVMRDMLYDGNAAYERGAVVCRVATSFIRFGNFQIFASRGDVKNLRALTDFTIRNYFDLEPSKENYVEFFRCVSQRTLKMIIDWQRVGFVHGVMNTDNMSIHGDTIDYGPYGWLEGYEPGWTPNTTDAQGRRYRYGHQPQIALWNLLQLANAIYYLVEDSAPFEEILHDYQAQFKVQYRETMGRKVGLSNLSGADDEWIQQLETVLQLSETDMTIFFRNLAYFSKDIDIAAGEQFLDPVRDAFYNPADIAGEKLEAWRGWFIKYAEKLRTSEQSDSDRRVEMNKVNPKYVLRNYMAQLAIDQADTGEFGLVDELYRLLIDPYSEQPEMEKWFAKRPEWARHKVGCSMLSCSS